MADETQAPIKPWEMSMIPTVICNEMDRRKTNRSFKYVDAAKGGWDSETGDWTKDNGPMTSWIRVCSNGRGASENGDAKPPFNKQGFIFYGGNSFYNTYGFNGSITNVANASIIGYMPDKNHTPHIIENDLNSSNYPIHVPTPEIERMSSVIQKELLRKVTIDWVCFSKAQLEYMTPYFLSPGISVLVEWGWNHFNPQSLVNLQDDSKMKDIFNNPYPLYTENILKSSGNYDVTYGIITNFEWNIEGNKIKCKTEITSKDRIYAGLTINSTATTTEKSNGSETPPKPMGGLPDFIKNVLPQFKRIKSSTSLDTAVSFTDNFTSPIPIVNLIGYLKARRPNDWKEYFYGIFYGRDLTDATNPFTLGYNTDGDFDIKKPNDDLWINMGLMVEIINFHSAPLRGMKAKEMFRIDIDNVLISGHPNLMSSDGGVCIIPNKTAPKYFYGQFGYSDINGASATNMEYDVLKKSSSGALKTSADGNLADYSLYHTCLPMGGRVVYRDNLDEIINCMRYGKTSYGNTFEFPSIAPIPNTSYKPNYVGYLKNIYVNIKFVNSVINDAEVKTYKDFIEKLMSGISAACGNFWDFRLVAATGDATLPKTDIATMKIIDNKFPYTANQGRVYTFDYFDADCILREIGFKPTMSPAQTARAMYAPINSNRSVNLSDGSNELLDYQFRDRLFAADEEKVGDTPIGTNNDTSIKETMRLLQQIKPPEGSYQITSMMDGVPIVRRLVLPSPEILNSLLDDSDNEHNPKYLGIMSGIQATFTIQGIGGLRTFMMFLVRNLPKPYSETNILFRIIDMQDTIETGGWTTTITAGIIPLRKSVRDHFGIKLATKQTLG